MTQFQPTISDEMTAKVAVILGPASSQEAKDAAGIQIEEYPLFASYAIECILKGEVNGEAFEIEPLMVNSLTIEQDFDNTYMNHIDLNITTQIIDFLTLYDGYQNLKCDIILRQAHHASAEVKEEPTHILSNYKVLFKDKEDLRKKIPKRSLIPDDGGEFNIEQQDAFIDLSLQLIEETAYKLRVKQFTFQMPDSTVKDAILYIATVCGISTIAMAEPDNTEELENLIMPPLQTFNTALEYLQERYGVYYEGLSYYFDADVLYIYPKYNTNPSMPVPGCKMTDIPNLYFIGGMKFPDMEVNHAVDKYNATHIVINHATSNTDLVDAGIENHGTGIMLADTGRMIDQWRSVLEPHGDGCARIGLGKMNVFKTPNVILMALEEAERKKLGMDPSVSIIKYDLNENNNYKKMVPINSYKRTSLITSWDNAVPFVFKPGYKIMWHYDDENKDARDGDEKISEESSMYTTKPGVVNGVSYGFVQHSRIGTTNIFRCIANLNLQLEMDTGDADSNASSSTDITEAAANRNMGGGSAHKLANTSYGSGGVGYSGSISMQEADQMAREFSMSSCITVRLLTHYKHLKSKDKKDLTVKEIEVLKYYEAMIANTDPKVLNHYGIF